MEASVTSSALSRYQTTVRLDHDTISQITRISPVDLYNRKQSSHDERQEKSWQREDDIPEPGMIPKDSGVQTLLSNLERNLYLTVQLLEMKPKLVIALNMLDVAETRGHQIDVAELSRLLGTPVVPMIAARNKGTEELLRTIIDVAEEKVDTGGITIHYGHDVESEIEKLENHFSENPIASHYSSRWLAVKLLEEDEELTRKIEQG